MEEKKITPYRTRSGLEIGKFYVPPEKKDTQSFDNQLLQEALLASYEKTSTAREIWKKFLIFINK